MLGHVEAEHAGRIQVPEVVLDTGDVVSGGDALFANATV